MARPEKTRALPRGQRSHPQEALIFSTNFPTQMLTHSEKCFVPLSDYAKLQKKYTQLFKRYKRKV